VETQTGKRAWIYTDESKAYNRISQSGRKHSTVCHSRKEYARDDNRDGILEVHCNSCEGLWTELRNFLRPFKGVHKKYLAQYIAQFENAFNFKQHFEDIIRAMIVPDFFLELYVSP